MSITENDTQPDTKSELVTKIQLSQRLSKSIRTIDNWMKDGLIPSIKFGTSVFFDWEEVVLAIKSADKTEGSKD